MKQPLLCSDVTKSRIRQSLVPGSAFQVNFDFINVMNKWISTIGPKPTPSTQTFRHVSLLPVTLSMVQASKIPSVLLSPRAEYGEFSSKSHLAFWCPRWHESRGWRFTEANLGYFGHSSRQTKSMNHQVSGDQISFQHKECLYYPPSYIIAAGK